MKLFKTIILFLVIEGMPVSLLSMEIPKITCEMMRNPSGITGLPRLGWQLGSTLRGDKQTAYQIIVSTSLDKITNGNGDEWNTNKVISEQSQFIVYAGKSLQIGVRYYWRVKVWDVEDKESEWSAPAYWEMAPDFSSNSISIKWIGAVTREDSHLPEGRNFHAPSLKKPAMVEMYNAINPLAKRSIMLRKPLHVNKKITSAVVYISGLGHYELTLNGHKVGSSEFAPLWSDYDKTVYYNTYHVEEELNNGNNVIGVMLGNGMYNVIGDRYRKLWVSFGPPTLFFQLKLRYEDGSEETVASDESWRYAESPITFNCIYGGEDYDANLEQQGWNTKDFDDATWKPVVVQGAPKGVLRPQLAAPVKEIKEYPIKEVLEPKPGFFVLNMGQNLSGYPTIKVQGKKGQVIKLLVGEALGDDGLVSQRRSGSPYILQYTLKGEGIEQWHPRFSYYGFQYIQMEGVDLKTGSGEKPIVVDVVSNFVYNSSGEAGTFECSNDLFNKAHVLINNAVKSNWQSVFTDCPHREKLGWLEETHLNGPGLFFNYNLTQFVPKVIQDMEDAQRANGLVPSIAPEYVIFGGDFTDSPEWGIASVVLPWMYYEYYGDKSILERSFPMMKKYVDYLSSKSDNYIVSHGLGDWYDYGDHAAGYSKNSPIPLSSTAHYYFGATLVEKAAKLLGVTEDAVTYHQLAEQIKDAYNKKFFNPETKQYGTGSQYSNAISLFLDLEDPSNKQAVLNNLIADIRKHGNKLTTGDVGNRYLYQVLARNDLNDIMYEMQNHYDTPGYGFQVKFGLTTLTEQWDPRKGNSWNHFMMGQIEEWFYCSLAGIMPDMAQPGFKHFVIQPHTVGDLLYVNATHETLYGDIKVNWKKEKGKFTLFVQVPVNTTAEVILPLPPGSKIQIDNTSIKKVKGVVKLDLKHSSVTLGSGEYIFTSP